MRKTALLLVFGIELIFLTACGGKSLDDIEPERTDTVAVRDNKFDPRVIEVTRGATVTWNWMGNAAHNVSTDEWASELKLDGDFQQRFGSSGTVDYRCTVHPGMTGRIIVTE